LPGDRTSELFGATGVYSEYRQKDRYTNIYKESAADLPSDRKLKLFGATGVYTYIE